MKYLIIGITLVLAGCGKEVTPTSNIQISKSIQSSPQPYPSPSPSATTQMFTAPFFSRAIGWINQVVTNGVEYGDAQNSIYECIGGGASYGSYPGSVQIQIGFYQNGTISITDPYGNIVMNSVQSGTNSEIVLISNGNPSFLLTAPYSPPQFLGDPIEILDVNNHLVNIELQYFTSTVSHDQGSIWACTLQIN